MYLEEKFVVLFLSALVKEEDLDRSVKHST